MLKVLSWGLGLQSTLLLELSAEGTLPKLDVAIFADTGFEHDYSHEVFNFYAPRAKKAGIEVVKIGGQDILGDNYKHVSLPLFIRGTDRQIKRKCTRDYKIRPIHRKIREKLGVNPRGRLRAGLVELWLGITVDEIHRAKPSRVAYIVHDWPLIDLDLDREKCAQEFTDRGLPIPKKSSCKFCPYQQQTEWTEKSGLEIALIADLQQHINHNGLVKIGGEDKKLSFIPNGDFLQADFSAAHQPQSNQCDGGYCNL